MATKVDIAGTSISAPQMSEFFRLAAVLESFINGATFQAYLERRNPFPQPEEKVALAKQIPLPTFERNEHGHILIPIIGLDLTGAQEIE